LSILVPEYVRLPRHAIQLAREHEQQVGKAIQILARRLANHVGLRKVHDRPFGAPTDSAPHVGKTGGTAAPGQDEFLQRR